MDPRLRDAVILGTLKITMDLIDSGIEYNISDAIKLAYDFDKLDIVKYFISKGADINHKYKCPGIFTLLMLEAYHFWKKRTDYAKLFIESGSDINAVNEDIGYTALIHACTSGNILVAKILIDAGCDTTIKDKYGRSALTHALNEGCLEIIKLLLNTNIVICKMDLKYAIERKYINNYEHKKARNSRYNKIIRLLCNKLTDDIIIECNNECEIKDGYIEHILLKRENIKLKEKIKQLKNIKLKLENSLNVPKIDRLFIKKSDIYAIVEIENKKLKKVIKQLEDKITELEFTPGGPGYLDAKKEFESFSFTCE